MLSSPKVGELLGSERPAAAVLLSTAEAERCSHCFADCALAPLPCFRCSAVRSAHRVPTPFPLPLRVAKAGRKHLNEEITLLLPTGIRERYSQTISNLGYAALLRRCELLI
jgi:hypothetical protein